MNTNNKEGKMQVLPEGKDIIRYLIWHKSNALSGAPSTTSLIGY